MNGISKATIFCSGDGGSAQSVSTANPRPLSAREKGELRRARREFMRALDAALMLGTPAAAEPPAGTRSEADLHRQERQTRRFMREVGMA